MRCSAPVPLKVVAPARAWLCAWCLVPGAWCLVPGAGRGGSGAVFGAAEVT
ncbi:hypothetical protein STRTUCAR8_09087 [Streptomyces turgidiscabies Car8]|uniref:Uncharacterized protein n=1 Tax=Streptomyces turgidiscabies (strain Car8) TaxID=698760 RepID=L7FEB7_STRT8|nr:hypothetical protein STRTUCAR8_09087 [Streptomyces turgidiscabies Car8]